MCGGSGGGKSGGGGGGSSDISKANPAAYPKLGYDVLRATQQKNFDAKEFVKSRSGYPHELAQATAGNLQRAELPHALNPEYKQGMSSTIAKRHREILKEVERQNSKIVIPKVTPSNLKRLQ
jgi:hypothetical protein